MSRRVDDLTILERWLLAGGLVLLTIFTAGLLHRRVSSGLALREFDRARTAAAAGVRNDPLRLGGEQEVHFSLWSEKRARAYRESLLSHTGSPLAVLRIGRLNIRVPVFEGTDELVLNRGVGWIAGTARPGETGNIGIAGHRDGFFRGLKDAALGDEVELSTLRGTSVYTTDRFEIVNPDNVGVLRSRGMPSLTLVTCYPFYFVGDAPQRFILHAVLEERDAANEFDNGSASARTK